MLHRPAARGGTVASLKGRRRERTSALKPGAVAMMLVAVAAVATIAPPLAEAMLRPFEIAAFKELNAACVGCHTELIQELSEGVVHAPVLLRPCGSCHEPHGLEEAARSVARSEGRHPTHGSSAAALRDAVPGCAACHPDITASPHGAAPGSAGAGADCLTCHAAHASGRRGMLVAEPTELCGGCHSPSAGHTEHSGMDCLECHRMHRPTASPLLADQATDVCVRCHPEAEGRYDHPTRPTHTDPNTGGGLTCTSSCHDPHGGAYEKMMRCPYGELGYGTDALCLKCHQPTELP